ncbi:hypothetical protein [Rathayibacter iranicus]|uniref:HipA-like C-terminal domain-containing protein n=2 Tax=Rathayibacter iranicus TaxID=59737 RepID=A0AAD1AE06_9MICO|nr:hypothetical protein [Rathayibacter iranicus]AZZ56552.1 hypothetical protein C7V51_12180 [Rathayibacter iranicus]MWV31901.1 hypothetical protein [Rathayibacter iranicus NCPPB 2253 = VKM Ac-1602]PPI58814.1 hypothetical protein C5E08_12020 [Rathayibacter iranicus]PWJ62427.1 hypothetical protein B0H03_11136 [Rathayibacter iranicus NCPPB 2253 = VKM Ac-1602]
MQPKWESMTIEGPSDGMDEPLGTKEKFWLVEESDLWLFKFARQRGGETRGEDWAEWVSFHLARLLAVPCAQVRPATVGGRRGIMSRNVIERDKSQRLEIGNSLLSQSDRHYDPTRRRPNERYTVEAVRRALDGVDAPAGFGAVAGMSGFDVWAGYLLFDAWVAGRDRHDENWAVIAGRGHRMLSPSFDHGNALGFQETEEKRAACLADSALFDRWVQKGRSHHFAGKPLLVDVARDALELAAPNARDFWLAQLSAVDPSAVREILTAVPTGLMSAACASFTEGLLDTTRRRILDDSSR